MSDKRKIEIFSAGCPVCESFVAQVREEACPSCDIAVLDMKSPEVAERAKQLGVGSLPSVAIDGVLASCCTSGGPDMAVLKEAGLGRPI